MKRSLTALIGVALAAAVAGGSVSDAATPTGVAISPQARTQEPVGIVRVGEKQVRHPQDVANIAMGTDPGTHVPIDIMRSGKRTTLDVQLAPLPQKPTAEN